MEFTGAVKYFEYKLAYNAPEQFFSELTRLSNTISELAGHHSFYRGLACIDIDEWAKYTTEPYFLKFLDYISSQSGRILTILSMHADHRRAVEPIKAALSSRLRFEAVWLRFPDPGELVEFIEANYFTNRRFHLTDDARALLVQSLEEIIGGRHFNGFVTVKRMANDILYDLLASGVGGHEITMDMLSGFSRNSPYIQRIKMPVVVGSDMGFSASREE
jgi:hypothetical protein